MKLLLDTHVWLWMQVSPDRFADDVQQLLRDRSHTVLLSAASAWEMAIKYGLGRLPLPSSPSEYVASRMAASGTDGLPVTHQHAAHVATLPNLHRDPFDRLLVAQAQLEGATLVTADAQVRAYPVASIDL